MKITNFIILILLIILGGCVDEPTPPIKVTNFTDVMPAIKNPSSPGQFKTVVRNGTEYIQARGEVGKYGGTLYTATIGQGPKTFNPWVSKDATSSEMAGLMFDSLLSTDAYTGDVIPLMAKSYSVSPDNTEYIVKLRKGLIWSDGTPITADDVVFTWNDIIKPGLGNASSRDNLLVNGVFPEIYKVDKYTVKFKTAKPFAPFLRQMGGISIAPKHILEPVVKKGEKYFSSYWGADVSPKSFVVSGKFKLTSYSTGQRVEFVRNPNYYMIDKAGNVLPYLDKYVVFVVADPNNELFKFKAKEIDIINIPGANVAKIKEEEIKPGSDFKIFNLGPTSNTTFMVLNLNNRTKNKNETKKTTTNKKAWYENFLGGLFNINKMSTSNSNKYYVDPIKEKWFQNIYFRKALDWAIDRKNIVNNVVQGVGAPLFTAESLPSIFINKELAGGHPKDIKKAKEYLKKGGFKLKDGILYDNNGHKVEFNLLTNAGNTEREAIGVIVKEDLEEIGIKVNFKPIEFNALVAKLTSFLDWDAIIIGLTGSTLEPHSGRNVWNSDGSLHLFNQRYGEDAVKKVGLLPFEKKLDELFEQGASELNLEARKKIYDEYQQVIYDNLPMIFLYSPLNIVAVRNRLANIKPTILGGVTHNLEEIYIKGNRK